MSLVRGILAAVMLLLLVCSTVNAVDVVLKPHPNAPLGLSFLNIYGESWDQYSPEDRTLYVRGDGPYADKNIKFFYAFNPSKQLRCDGPFLSDEAVQIKADAQLIPYDADEPGAKEAALSLATSRMNLIWTSQTQVGYSNNFLHTGAYIADHPWEDYCMVSTNPLSTEGTTWAFTTAGAVVVSGANKYILPKAVTSATGYGYTKTLEFVKAYNTATGVKSSVLRGAGAAGSGLATGVVAITKFEAVGGVLHWLSTCGVQDKNWIIGIDGVNPVSTGWQSYPKTCDTNLDSCQRSISIQLPNSPGLYNDYVAIVSACVKHQTATVSLTAPFTDTNWCAGIPEYICEAYVLPIRVVSEAYCGDTADYETPVGFWDKQCYTYGQSQTHDYPYYCDDVAHTCVDPCGTCSQSLGMRCLAAGMNVDDMKTFAKSSNNFACVPQGVWCTDTSQCVGWTQSQGTLNVANVQAGSDAYQKIETRVGNIPSAAAGVHCEKDPTKQKNPQIVAYNTRVQKIGNIATMGECQLGALTEADCREAFGPASEAEVLTLEGIPIRPVGWKVNSRGECILDWCSGLGCIDRVNGQVIPAACKAYDLNTGKACGGVGGILTQDWRVSCAGVCEHDQNIDTRTTCTSNADCAKLTDCLINKNYCYCTKTSQGFNVCGPVQTTFDPGFEAGICTSDDQCMFNNFGALKSCEKMVCDKTAGGTCQIRGNWKCSTDADCVVGGWTRSRCDQVTKCCVTSSLVEVASCSDKVCNGKEDCMLNKLYPADCGGVCPTKCPIIPGPSDCFSSVGQFYTCYYGVVWLMIGSMLLLTAAVFVVYAYQKRWIKW